MLFEGTHSSRADVLSGVPQGKTQCWAVNTYFSPTSELINDMPHSLRSSDARSFADDSLLYHTVYGNRDITLLQEDLTEEWGRIWRQLRFNPPKCTIMRITNRRRKNVYHFSNNLGG